MGCAYIEIDGLISRPSGSVSEVEMLWQMGVSIVYGWQLSPVSVGCFQERFWSGGYGKFVSLELERDGWQQVASLESGHVWPRKRKVQRRRAFTNGKSGSIELFPDEIRIEQPRYQ